MAIGAILSSWTIEARTFSRNGLMVIAASASKAEPRCPMGIAFRRHRI
jgi:hypothetical protein